MRNLWVAILLIISLALLLACNETNVSTGVDGDADGLADSDTDRDSDQADGDLDASGDADSDLIPGDSDVAEGDADAACTPDEYRCREAVLERCSLAGEWEFYRDCTLDGMECAAGDCIQPPDGDDEAEPDMEEIDGDGSEEIEDSEDDLPEGEREYEVEADSEPESEGWDIDPDDVVIGEECPQDGIRLCVNQVVVDCDDIKGWAVIVNCSDDGIHECWNGECINPDNPDYPGCTDNERRCVGTVLQDCTSEADWATIIDCANDGHICFLDECINP